MSHYSYLNGAPCSVVQSQKPRRRRPIYVCASCADIQLLKHSGGSGVTTWDISNPSQLKAIETKKFKLDKPGADPGRQEAPHPHQSITDPSGKFVLVPDLGSDSVRVFSVNCKTLALKDLPALNVKPGSGPRHVTFAVKNNKTFMYLVTELANTIIGYEVTYPAGSIKFQELFTIGTHGKGKPTPAGAAASEIIVSVSEFFLPDPPVMFGNRGNGMTFCDASNCG